MIKMRMSRWQYEYVNSKAKYNLLIAGRRAGKTHAETGRMMADSLRTPRYTTMYTTPDGSLCHEVFRTMVEDHAFKKRIAKVERVPARQIFLNNGSSIYIRQFDRPDRSVGMSFHHVIFDEIQKQEGMRGEEDFMRVIRPLIMDKRGSLTISGQWRGEACWWHKWYQKNIDNPDMRLWNVPSWEGMKFRDGKENHPEILDAKAMLPPNLFDQEIACIPSGNANAAFNFYDIKDCFAGELLDKGEKGRSYTIGADLGKVVDPSAWVVIDNKDRQVVHAEKRKLGEKHSIAAVKLNELSQRFNGARVVIDATGGATGGRKHKDVFLRFYRKYVKNLGKYILTQQSKEDMIAKLNLAFQNQTVFLPEEAEELVSQLSSYEAVPNRWGGFRYMGPNGHDDDLVIALGMAYDIVDRGRSNDNEGGDFEGFTRT